MGSWTVDYEKLMLISVTQNHDILETITSDGILETSNSTSSLLFRNSGRRRGGCRK